MAGFIALVVYPLKVLGKGYFNSPLPGNGVELSLHNSIYDSYSHSVLIGNVDFGVLRTF